MLAVERVNLSAHGVEERHERVGSGGFIRTGLVAGAVRRLVCGRTGRCFGFAEGLPHAECGRVLVTVHHILEEGPVGEWVETRSARVSSRVEDILVATLEP